MRQGMLRVVLFANAAFSGASGVVFALAAGGLAEWAGVPATLLRIVGVGLIGFAAAVVRVARRPVSAGVGTIVGADAAWVAGAAVLLVVRPEAMTAAGRTALLALSGVVAVLAVLQAAGLRRMATRSAEGRPRERVVTGPRGDA